jgi:hypothetical protein
MYGVANSGVLKMLDLTKNRYSSQWRAENAAKKFKIVGQKIKSDYNVADCDAGDVFSSEEQARRSIDATKKDIQDYRRRIIMGDRRDITLTPELEKKRQREIDQETDLMDSVLEKIKNWKIEAV